MCDTQRKKESLQHKIPKRLLNQHQSQRQQNCSKKWL